MPLSPDSPEFLRIESYLFRGRPQPGDRVATEDELIARLGVTRYRARQALDLLVQMGILERRKRAGTVVKRLATRDMTQNILEQFRLAGFDEAEFNEARVMIETAVLPFVAERLTPAVKARMRELAEAIRASASEPLRADAHLMEFHLLMLEACGNRVMEVFANVVRTYFRSTKHLIEHAPEAFFLERARLCEELLAALAEKRIPEAERSLRRMITGSAGGGAPAAEEP